MILNLSIHLKVGTDRRAVRSTMYDGALGDRALPNSAS
jgi:hypothetical protein